MLFRSQDISRFLVGEPIEAKPVGPLVRTARKMRRHIKVILIYAVVLFLTINGIVLALNASFEGEICQWHQRC